MLCILRWGRESFLMIPYVLLTVLYMFVFLPFTQLPPETFTAAIAKAAPIWYLALYTSLTPKYNDNILSQGVWTGLVLSSVGDMCLIWRTTLFLPGMFFFGLAHLAYIFGQEMWLREGRRRNGRYVLQSFVVCVVCYLFLFTGMESWVMAGCVLVYTNLVFTMANLALQRHLVEGNQGSLCGAVGGALFALSDFLIGVDKWKWSFPMSEGVIMLTYYIAQGAIAYSAFSSARAKRREWRQ